MNDLDFFIIHHELTNGYLWLQMFICERVRDLLTECGKLEEEEEKRERLILHFLHAPGGRQLTFTADMLGRVTAFKLRPFQRTT